MNGIVLVRRENSFGVNVILLRMAAVVVVVVAAEEIVTQDSAMHRALIQVEIMIMIRMLGLRR